MTEEYGAEAFDHAKTICVSGGLTVTIEELVTCTVKEVSLRKLSRRYRSMFTLEGIRFPMERIRCPMVMSWR